MKVECGKGVAALTEVSPQLSPFRPVAPAPNPRESSTTTVPAPASPRWYATTQPVKPAPITTTSACDGSAPTAAGSPESRWSSHQLRVGTPPVPDMTPRKQTIKQGPRGGGG